MAVETFEDNFIELEAEPKWNDKVRGFALESWVQGGATGVDNVPLKDLAERTEYLKDKTEYLKKEVDTIIGLSPGGFLDANDFGTDTPTQQMLTDYALLKIGGTDQLRIWNGTRVKNLFDGNIWILTNTPETDPPVFEWANNGSDAVVVDVAGNVFAASPFIVSIDKRKLAIKAGTKILLGERTFNVFDEDVELDVAALLDTGSLQNGKDYYIFLCPGEESGSIIIKISLTKTNPQGFTSADVLLIGGFHTLCVNAGSLPAYTIGGVATAHPLSGYVAGDILPYSVWCLNHRPYSEPEGMVYIPLLDFWCDIYLQSGNGAQTKSAYQGAITRSRQYVDHVEDMLCVKKELLDDGEFAAAMMGSNETTAVAGASEAGATTGGAGGRLDTASRRMISIFGVEEGCGSVWQWLRSTSAAGAVGSMYGDTGSGAQGWINATTGSYGPYPQSGGKGSFWGVACALLAGGDWYASAGCGSRARLANAARSRADASHGSRGRSRTKR